MEWQHEPEQKDGWQPEGRNAAGTGGKHGWNHELNWRESRRKPSCQEIMTHIIAHLLNHHAQRCATCPLWSTTRWANSLKHSVCCLDAGKQQTERRETLVRLVSTRAERVTCENLTRVLGVGQNKATCASYQVWCGGLGERQPSGDDEDVVLLFTDSTLWQEPVK